MQVAKFRYPSLKENGFLLTFTHFMFNAMLKPNLGSVIKGTKFNIELTYFYTHSLPGYRHSAATGIELAS